MKGKLGILDDGSSVGSRLFYCKGINPTDPSEYEFLTWNTNQQGCGGFPDPDKALSMCINRVKADNAYNAMADALDIELESEWIINRLAEAPTRRRLFWVKDPLDSNIERGTFILVYRGIERRVDGRLSLQGDQVWFTRYENFPLDGIEQSAPMDTFSVWIHDGWPGRGYLYDITEEILKMSGQEIEQAENSSEELSLEEEMEHLTDETVRDYAIFFDFNMSSGETRTWRAEDSSLGGDRDDIVYQLTLNIVEQVDKTHGVRNDGAPPNDWLMCQSQYGLLSVRKKEVESVETRVVPLEELEEEDDDFFEDEGNDDDTNYIPGLRNNKSEEEGTRYQNRAEKAGADIYDMLEKLSVVDDPIRRKFIKARLAQACVAYGESGDLALIGDEDDAITVLNELYLRECYEFQGNWDKFEEVALDTRNVGEEHKEALENVKSAEKRIRDIVIEMTDLEEGLQADDLPDDKRADLAAKLRTLKERLQKEQQYLSEQEEDVKDTSESLDELFEAWPNMFLDVNEETEEEGAEDTEPKVSSR